MQTVLGTTKDTPNETTRFVLNLPPAQTRRKVEQAKAQFSTIENPRSSLHGAVRNTKGCRLGWCKSWMGQAEGPALQVWQLTELKQTQEWQRDPKWFHLCDTLLPENLGEHCWEWPAGKMESEIKLLTWGNSKLQDLTVYTDGSVTKDQSGWGFTVEQGAATIHEDSAAYTVSTSSLTMEVEAVTHALRWIALRGDSQTTHVVILTDSMSLLQQVKSGTGSPDWNASMANIHLLKLLCVYCPGHAWVKGND